MMATTPALGDAGPVDPDRLNTGAAFGGDTPVALTAMDPEVDPGHSNAFRPIASLLDTVPLDPGSIETVVDSFRSLSGKGKIAAIFNASGPDGSATRAGILLVVALNDADPHVVQAAAHIYFERPDIINHETSLLVPASLLHSPAWLSELRWLLSNEMVDVVTQMATGNYVFARHIFDGTEDKQMVIALGRALRSEQLMRMVAFGRMGPDSIVNVWGAFDLHQKVMLLEMVTSAPRPPEGESHANSVRFEEPDFFHAGVSWPFSHAGPKNLLIEALQDKAPKVVMAALDAFLTYPHLLPDADRAAILRHVDSKHSGIRKRALQALCWEETAGPWAVFQLQLLASLSGTDENTNETRDKALHALDRLGVTREYDYGPRRKTGGGTVLGVYNDSSDPEPAGSTKEKGSDAA